MTYSPTVIPPDNGEVTIFPTSPKQDETVTITPKPDDGYEVDRVTVTDSEGKEITVRDNGDGTYSFIQPDGEVTITVTYQEIICPRDSTCPLSRFSDVFINAWYHDGIHYCLSNGLMKGTSDAVDNATFEPNGVTNRAMLVTVLYRLEGEPEVGACPFTDVQADVWYTDAITWAAENQIVKGYGNQLFGPEDYITREQFATILYRYAAYKGYDVTAKADITTFVDGADTAYWAADAMAWAVAEKLIIGMGNNQLAPRGDATRAQMATILYRFFKNLSK